MAKQLNVNLAFTADTSKAVAQMQNLQNQLSQIAAAPAKSLSIPWTKELQEASTAAIELKVHLQNATNVKTGSLDFTKLNASIQKSGKTLAEYGRQLQALGPQGQQAFMSLANAVAQAEIPIKRSNAMLNEMMTTLKNTARWQLSSSILHGFMGAIQSAYGYAQDLNASLNDIRIVTGQNIEQMAQFAEKANKAAKALSTTTTSYTNASLIYYQQGLSDTEVAKRTEVTVKMANAAGQSAEIVSDQLTAVWNNFYNGSKSLEYYADVMTALGAATASSTEEIAGGLEKFAAIADTIGLSYEYAAAALATITSNTRQSEEVVGTALKTIFARIQGLNLGETLDDGVTLNKYSEALQKVGINIIDASGKMKDMDLILDEMANKWDNLSKAQQVALAQTVAGIRQYNQLIALMDNWNAGDADSMTSNLKTAYNATGTLQKQADIQAESWEAAQNRVRAAAEGVYSSLLDEDFFIGILNGLEKVLNYVDSVIDSLGGLKGVLTSVGVIMTKVFSTQMTEGLRNIAHNIYMSTEGGRQAVANEKLNQMRQMREDMALGREGIGSEVGQVANEQFEQQLNLQEELMLNSQNMSEAEIANAQQLLDLRKQIGEEVVKAKQAEIDAKEKVANAREKAYVDMGTEADKYDGILGNETIDLFKELQQKLRLVNMSIGDVKVGLQSLDGTLDAAVNPEVVNKLRLAFQDGLGKELNMTEQEVKQFFKTIEAGGKDAEAALKGLMDKLYSKSGNIQGSMNKNLAIGKTVAREMAQGYEEMARGAHHYKSAAERAAQAQEEVVKRIQAAKGVVKDWANGLVSGAQAVMSFASIINTASSAIDTLTNPDMSGWEKFLSILQSSAMMITMTVSLFNSLSQAQKNWEKGTLKNAAATLIEAAATALSTKANEKNAQAQYKKAAGHEVDSNAAKKDAINTTVEGKVTEQNNNKNIKSNKKLSESFGDLKTSAGEWIKAYKGQIGGAVAVAAAIAIVVATISTAINYYNRFEKAAAEAAAASEMMADKYNEAKNTYDTFSNTLNGYKNAVASLEDLTKGTAEYTEATMKANEQALELINNYKGLAGQYTIKDGLIVIDEEALAKVQQAELEKVGRAQAMNILSSAQAREAQSKADKAKYNREMDSKSDDVWSGKNGAVGAAAGGAAGFLGTVGVASMMGASLGPVGMIAGAAVGAIVGGVSALIATEAAGAEAEAEAAATNKVIEYVQKNGNDIFAAKDAEEFGKMLEKADLKIDDTNLVESLYANKDALEQLTEVEVAKLNQEYADWQAAYAAYNMGNTTYTNAESQAYLNNVAYNAAHDQATIDSVTSGVQDLWGGSNDDFWKAYLEEVLGDTNVDEDSTTGDNYRVQDLYGEGVTLQKKNAEGVWVNVGEEDGLSEEVAEQQLINARLMAKANEGLTQNIADYQTLAHDLSIAGVTDSDNAKTIIEGYSSKTGKVDLSKMLPETVNSIVTDAIRDPDLRKAVSDAIDEYKQNIPSWYNALTPSEKELAWNMNIDKDASIDEVKKAVAAMQGYLDSVQLTTSLGVFSEMEGLLQNQDWGALKTKFTQQGWTEQDWLEFMSQGSLDAMSQWLAAKEEAVRDAGREDNEDGIKAATDYHNTQVDEYRSAIDNATTTKAEADALKPQVMAASEKYTNAQNVYNTTVSQKRDEYINNADAIWAQAYSYMDKYNPARSYEVNGQTYQIHDSSLAGMTDFLNNMDTTGPDQAYLVGQLQTLFNGFKDSNGQLTSEQRDAIWHLAGYFSGSTDVYGMDLLGEGDQEAYQEWINKLQNVSYINNYEGVDNASYVNGIIASIIPYLGETDGAVSDARNAVEQAWGEYNELDYKYRQYQGDDGLIADAQAKVKAEKGDIEGKKGSSAQLAATYQAQIALQESLKKAVEAVDFSMEEFGAYYQQLEAQHIVINGLTEGTTAYAVALEKIALTQMRTNRGLETFTTSWEDWNKVMSDGNAPINDIVKIMPQLNAAMAGILDLDLTDIQALPADFMRKNWPLIEQVINGAEGAMEKLQGLVAKEYFLSIGVDATGLNEQAQAAYNQIGTWLSNMPDLEAGITLNDQGMTSAFQTLMAQAHMTVAEMEAAFDAFGFTPEIKVAGVGIPQALQQLSDSGFIDVIDPLTGRVTRVTTREQMTAMSSSGKVSIASINGDTSVYKGGGGSNVSPPMIDSKSKKPDSIKKEDMIDRYKELNDSLERVADAMSDAEKAANRLYGKSRLKQMEKINDELLKEIDLQKRKRKEAEEYLKNIDKPALEEAFKALSSEFGLGEEIQLQFNTDDSIKNIETIMDMVIAAYKAKAEELKDSMNEADKALLENMKATIKAFKDAIGQYDKTRSTIREAENARQDAFNKWQDNNYEQLSYSLEIDLEINKAKLQDLEYRIKRLDDTAAEMAEAIGLIYSSTGGSQYDFYDEAIKRYASQRDTLDTAYRSGRISQADYVEGLREVSDGIYKNLEALNDLDKTMMEYYGNTLAAANKELDKFIERMSHSAGILEHYSSIMDLLGKSSDYKTMGVILEGQANVAENQVKSSKAIMEMMQSEAENRYQAYLQAGNEEAKELYLKQYEEALAAAQEAEDEYLSNAEQWAESLKAILENKLADLGKTLEEALTGGTSFEQLTTQMKRAASLQEEYLTSTNQIYETTKMMRAAQQEIDKTTNTVAKNKIANFIAETKQLQNQSKLSNYELKVQQAKYDLLLAEIALQEAQNAKSTVRLQRDAEGNFGYVYTADSNAIADATQKYEDAQNALYNIGLKGANDYGQKYQQTMNEMYDSLTELQNQYLSGAFESESAYNLAVEEAKRYYYAKLEQYSSLYATATMADSRVVAEAWFNDFSEMMTTSETWKLAVEEHVANVSSAFGEWQSQVEAIASDTGVGGDLESLKSKVNEIVTETNKLTDELTRQGGTIDSLQSSLDFVKKSTDAYAELRKQLQLAAERYREVAQAASEAAATEALIDRSNEQIKDFGEQADECIRKIESTYAEMEEKLKEAKEQLLRGEINEKRYNEQVEAIKNQYYKELKKLSQEYREILAKDNDLVAEDWFLTLEEMLKTEETFNQSVEEYLKEVEEYFKNMGQTTQDVAVETGGILKTFTADVGGVKEAIDLLNKSIVDSGGLVDAFEAQDGAIENSCGLYGDLDTKLRTVIQTYEALAAAARDAAHAQSSVSGGGGGGSSYSGIDMHIPRSEFSYAHFDTGGYTGQWGSYGKLAMLHEKELVLNKDDTENFLASMGILNNILQTIDLQSANAQIGGILTTPNFHGGGNDMLEQNVHIEASFPNVQNSNDIEEAFNNLINRASQYANRK